MLDTQRKLAVVTGASTGIGLELAKECAKNNFNLIIAPMRRRLKALRMNCAARAAPSRQCKGDLNCPVPQNSLIINEPPRSLSAPQVKMPVGPKLARHVLLRFRREVG
jgi:NAD(P)-dependent dehydrogenase (short-subunit alcohol dehydrogenase family)